ncbi:MAG: glycosyltransferase [Chitinophagales bacterium]|nr:glycosyltransferase [Chitinophagales bacterium]
MKLSIVIVNYNVRYFLELCLQSVQKAIANIPAEVFVVDNNSADDSVETIRTKYNWVKLIANPENVGFSKANNQAIAQSTGEYILLLNPDTVLAEDTLEKCVAFMDNHPNAGGLGVRMIDGTGKFLPESKRGLPTPAVAFYKTFGLAALFPKSTTFGKYHLGFLSENETHEVDVLSGAFMLLRKSVIDKIGALDETFFMYGEDIDLSYRIQKAGYKNYYFSDTTIIHYKGESTKKGSLNYVKVFYNAMLIFARKHFSGNQSALFSILIYAAIIFRGALTFLAGIFASSYLFLIDALVAYAGVFFIADYWEKMIKYQKHYYPEQFFFIVVPLYIFLWIIASYLSGAYDKPYRSSKVLRGVLLGTIGIAVVYAFLPNEWRFSRAIILLGAAWTVAEMLVSRYIHGLVRKGAGAENGGTNPSMLAVTISQFYRIQTILHSLGNFSELINEASVTNTHKATLINRCGEVIFYAGDYSFKEIIGVINKPIPDVSYKILIDSNNALVGSNSKNTAGDLYVAERNYLLFQPANQRSKRLIDLAICMLTAILFPLTGLWIKNRSGFAKNWWMVLLNKKSWVGFHQLHQEKRFSLAKPGVLAPHQWQHISLSTNEQKLVELNYARFYTTTDDLRIIWKNYRLLGN